MIEKPHILGTIIHRNWTIGVDDTAPRFDGIMCNTGDTLTLISWGEFKLEEREPKQLIIVLKEDEGAGIVRPE